MKTLMILGALRLFENSSLTAAVAGLASLLRGCERSFARVMQEALEAEMTEGVTCSPIWTMRVTYLLLRRIIDLCSAPTHLDVDRRKSARSSRSFQGRR